MLNRIEYLSLVTTFIVLFILGGAIAAVPQNLENDRELVRTTQRALLEKGFPPGPIDGIVGNRTRGALRSFQEAEGLTADGRMTEETLEKLGVDVRAQQGAGGLVGRVASGTRSVGATAAKGAVTAAETTEKGAMTAADATARGTKTAAGATVEGTKTAAGATARGATKAGEATAGAATTAARATTEGAKTAAEKTRQFLFGKNADDRLQVAVQEVLISDAEIEAAKVSVSVKDGVATLEFKAGDRTIWDRAASKAREVEGVRSVVLKTP